MQHFQRINVSFYEKVTTVLATTSVKNGSFLHVAVGIAKRETKLDEEVEMKFQKIN